MGQVLASTANRQPATGTDPAYYRTASNQSGSAPSDPSWAETTHIEFSSADYVAVQTDDGSRTLRSATASITGRWCAAEELFTFDLSSYSSIQSVYIHWQGYGTLDVNGLVCALYVKTGASTWTNLADIQNTMDEDDYYNDTNPYTNSGIYKVAIFGLSVKVGANAAVSLRTDYMIITVYYVAAGGVTTTVRLNQTTTVQQALASSKHQTKNLTSLTTVLQAIETARHLHYDLSQNTVVLQSLFNNQAFSFSFSTLTVVTQVIEAGKILTRSFSLDTIVLQALLRTKFLGFSFSQEAFVNQSLSTNRAYEFLFSQLTEALMNLVSMRQISWTFETEAITIMTLLSSAPLLMEIVINQAPEVLQGLIVEIVDESKIALVITIIAILVFCGLIFFIMYRRREE